MLFLDFLYWVGLRKVSTLEKDFEDISFQGDAL